MSTFYLTSLVLMFGSFSIGWSALPFGFHNVLQTNLKLHDRLKRSDDGCVKTCLQQQLGRQAAKYIPKYNEDTLNSHTIIPSSKQELKALCQYTVKPALTCIEQCEESTPEWLNSVALLGDFLCVEHYDEIYENFECLKRAEFLSEIACHKGTCKHLSQNPRDFEEQLNLRLKNQDYYSVKNIIAKFCKFISCEMQCEKPIYTNMCGAPIADLIVNDFVPLSVEVLKSALELSNLWPPQCEQIMRGYSAEEIGDK